MKRILVVGLTGQMGGTENYIYNLIQKINLKKYKFDFLVVEDGHKTPYEQEINDLIGDGEDHFYYCPNLKKHYVSGCVWLKNFYEENLFDLIYMNATTAAKSAYCRYAIDIQHVPMIMHSHRSEGKKINHYLYRKYSYKHSSFKLACSKNAAEWMYGKKSSEAIVIPNGINTDRFAFSVEYRKKIREKIGVSENDIIIGHVGRFSAEKNQNFLVDLCMELKEKYKFICIGDGPLKQEIEAKVKKNNLTDRFIILPVSKNVNEYYSAMDFFALPSFNEGLPIVSVEAQCAGLTCLFSDKVSKETNISGYCEYLSLADIKQWKELIEKKDISRFDGVEAVKKAGFDMTNSANCIISLFDRVHRYNNA